MAGEALMSPQQLQPANSEESVIRSDQALRKANGYLTLHVGMFFRAEEPVFLPLASPVWQALVQFQMYDIGPFPVSLLDIDATTGEVVPFTDDHIDLILDRADAYAATCTSTTAPPF